MLEEASEIQDIRNAVVHRGEEVTPEQAALAIDVAMEIFSQVLSKVLAHLGLSVEKGGLLVNEEVGL